MIHLTKPALEAKFNTFNKATTLGKFAKIGHVLKSLRCVDVSLFCDLSNKNAEARVELDENKVTNYYGQPQTQHCRPEVRFQIKGTPLYFVKGQNPDEVYSDSIEGLRQTIDEVQGYTKWQKKALLEKLDLLTMSGTLYHVDVMVTQHHKNGYQFYWKRDTKTADGTKLILEAFQRPNENHKVKVDPETVDEAWQFIGNINTVCKMVRVPAQKERFMCATQAAL